jgi:hypothetical protein
MDSQDKTSQATIMEDHGETTADGVNDKTVSNDKTVNDIPSPRPMQKEASIEEAKEAAEEPIETEKDDQEELRCKQCNSKAVELYWNTCNRCDTCCDCDYNCNCGEVHCDRSCGVQSCGRCIDTCRCGVMRR